MDYFSLLQLNREPFSNAPDPDLFFPSFAHHDCMQKVELAVRLRRGLNVVTGDVGTGKTTLCRALIRSLAEDGRIKTHLFLDPAFPSAVDFLSAVAAAFAGVPPSGASDAPAADESAIKEQVKNSLFRECAEKGDIHLLIIDEGQKLPGFALEILRELLNYETNEYKLLQIVIFAQPEFEQIIQKRENFKDRINLFYRMGPLNLRETVGFIRFRISKASAGRSVLTFTPLALWRIYRFTGGYPRKIIHLCHQALLALIIQNKTRITAPLVTAAARRTTRGVFVEQAPVAPLVAGILVGLALIAGGLLLFSQDRVGNDAARSGRQEIPAQPEPGTGTVETPEAAAEPPIETARPEAPQAPAPVTSGEAVPEEAPPIAASPELAPVSPPVKIIRSRFRKPAVLKSPVAGSVEESRGTSDPVGELPSVPMNSSQGEACHHG